MDGAGRVETDRAAKRWMCATLTWTWLIANDAQCFIFYPLMPAVRGMTGLAPGDGWTLQSLQDITECLQRI